MSPRPQVAAALLCVIVPIIGLIVQSTAVDAPGLGFVMTGRNCCNCDALRVASEGLTPVTADTARGAGVNASVVAVVGVGVTAGTLSVWA